MGIFTQEELDEMARADAEIDESFVLTPEDIRLSMAIDREAKFQALPPEKKKVAAQQKAYREANKEKVADYQKAYREANKEKLAAQQKARYRGNPA